MSGSAPEMVRLDILDDLSTLLRCCHHGTSRGFVTFGTTNPDELELRFAGALFVLTRLHQVDSRGRCRACRPIRSARGHWLRWPTGKAECRVLKIVAFFAMASEEDIWLRLLPRLGIRLGLNELRAHLENLPAEQHLAGMVPIPHQDKDSGRHFLFP